MKRWLRPYFNFLSYLLYRSGFYRLPNGYAKQFIVRRAFEQLGGHLFIETGTLNGQMLANMLKVADRIHSIELDANYFERATQRFEQYEHITVHQGDSAVVLPKILENVNETGLFWLDAHYSGGDTAKADLETSISSELQALLAHSNRHLILIDDARCFDGTHDYPTIDEVTALVESRYTVRQRFDMLWLLPIA